MAMVDHINSDSAALLLDWCINRYGLSQHAKIKTLKIKLNPKLKNYGQYFPYTNTIVINPEKTRTLLSFCNTIINEYTHFQQNMFKYAEYRNSYENHPYEHSANNRAARDQLEARRWLLRQIRNR
jgi:hypothetical protein